MEKLTGHDYMTKTLGELQTHPDFSRHAYRIIQHIGAMQTEEIEQLHLVKEL